ncbi:hypothetical protein ABBQ32_010519 [Trebouxia sp. C0010 RCD-2024]
MRSSTGTHISRRQAGWPAGLASSCPQQGVPARAAPCFARAYVTQPNARTWPKTNGIAVDLQDIKSPVVNIVHVKRQSQLQNSDLSELVQKVSSFRSNVRCTHASSAEAEQLLNFLPKGPVSEVLSADIQNLLHQFLEVSGFEAIDASLSVITSTSCPRFHADHVELRCLCTYSGEGTYFVPNAAVDRRRWMRALGIHNTNGFGVKSERDIHQAGEWDIVVLKGNAFPGNEGASCTRPMANRLTDLLSL